MNLEQHQKEVRARFDNEFQHSNACGVQKVDDPCICDYDEFKSFLETITAEVWEAALDAVEKEIPASTYATSTTGQLVAGRESMRLTILEVITKLRK